MAKMLSTALAIAALGMLSGCEPPEQETVRAVEAFGFHDVRLTGYRIWGCGQDDTFHEGFAAANQAGQRVTGVVCSSFLKGATVRVD